VLAKSPAGAADELKIGPGTCHAVAASMPLRFHVIATCLVRHNSPRHQHAFEPLFRVRWHPNMCPAKSATRPSLQAVLSAAGLAREQGGVKTSRTREGGIPLDATVGRCRLT
jgi:hypothetical protein